MGCTKVRPISIWMIGNPFFFLTFFLGDVNHKKRVMQNSLHHPYVFFAQMLFAFHHPYGDLLPVRCLEHQQINSLWKASAIDGKCGGIVAFAA